MLIDYKAIDYPKHYAAQQAYVAKLKELVDEMNRQKESEEVARKVQGVKLHQTQVRGVLWLFCVTSLCSCVLYYKAISQRLRIDCSATAKWSRSGRAAITKRLQSDCIAIRSE